MAAHPNYRRRWTDAGYKSDMGSAIACLPPTDANAIRVYHLTSAEFAVSNIALARLKIARFSDLNDPFELLGLNFRERADRKVISSFKNAYNAHSGLLCFSSDWAEPVMWSHYGMRHRGICLGFNVPRSNLQKVQYEDNRILAELGDDPNPESLAPDLQSLLLCTKSSGWKYEDEYRQFVPLATANAEGRLHFLPFSGELELAEVILGPLCDHSLQAIRDLVSSRHSRATTFSTRLAFKSYKVVPNESTVL